MSVLENKILPAAIVLVAVYTLYVQPIGAALTAIGIGSILFATTKSKSILLAVLVVALFIKPLNRLLAPKPEPMGVESFQTRDPVSVQARIEAVKTAAPLAPKVQAVTGVLESSSILDNTPLQAVDEFGVDGVPRASIPASTNARVLIYPPSEESVPAPKESLNVLPKDNPYLQTGQDRLAEEVAHAQRGTDLYAPDSGTINGVAGGAAPAF